MKKKILGALAIVLVLCVAVGGTLAYLFDTTDVVVNTFTFGNVDIDLSETTGTNYKMVPGDTMAKDPKVTVSGNSEDSYVFIEVIEANDLDTYVQYAIDTGVWTKLASETEKEVYYLTGNYTSNVADQDYYILAGEGDANLKNGKVTVSNAITKTQIDALNGKSNEEMPKLSFKAYAIQKDNIADVDAAWTAIEAALA
ncbi:MAG: hypothetical protein IJ462_02715 [Clostridia bacterium]|nr:hypothetical protein [Clostridia bacterium]